MGKSIRIPLAEPLTNRDSTATKDSKLTNCFMQNVAGQPAVVKRPGTLAAIQNTVGQGQGTYCYNGYNYTISGAILSQNTAYYTVAGGTVGTIVNGATEEQGFIAFNNKLWIIGGYLSSYLTNVYSSSDGVAWAAQTSAPFARRAFGLVVANGYMYVIGGQSTSVTSSVYRSSDGNTWTQISTSNPWGDGVRGSAFLSSRYLWFIPENISPGGTTSLYTSLDGITWTTITSTGITAGTTARSTIYNGRIYIFGYDIAGSPTNKIWSSVDGTSWEQTKIQPGSNVARFINIFPYAGFLWYAYATSVSGPTSFYRTSDLVNWSLLSVTTQPAGDVLRGSPLPTFAGSFWAAGPLGADESIWNSGNLSGPNYTTTTYPVANGTSAYQFSSVGGSTSPLLVLKNNDAMYTFDPATNTLTRVTSANYPALTVPGLVYLDGTFYVATADSKIYGSAIEDPTTWSALNYISAEIESDGLVAIEKSLNYIVAFGQWTTEFFYDAGNATGSPLSSVPNAFFTVGCASGTSVVRMENEVVWMSQTIQRGRQIMALSGFTPSIISTPEVDRILNADDLATVYAFSVKISGSVFYVLTLKTSAKTLVYDFSTKQWHFWTSMTPQTAKNVTTITSTSGVATVTEAAHGYADGDLITIAGANEAAYNGSFNITYVDANTYTYPVPLGTVSPATGTITAVGYDESYFKGVGYSFCGGGDLIQGETDGIIYSVSPLFYDDNGVYINTKIKTIRIDGGESKRKFVSKAEIIGDKVAATGLLRYTDDDYVTYSVYRPIDMNAKRSMLLRGGHTRRRAYEFRCTASVPLRIEALELDVEPGTS